MPSFEDALGLAQPFLELEVAGRAAGAHHQVVNLDRLAQVVASTRPDGFDSALDVAVRGHHQHDGRRKLGPQLGQEDEPISIRQPPVQHDEVRRLGGERGAGLMQRARDPDAKTLLAQHGRRERGEGPVVIDEQQGGAHEAIFSSGRRTVKRLPPGTRV